MGVVKSNSVKTTIISYAGAGIGFVNRLLLFPHFLNTEQVGLVNLLPTIATLYAQLATFGIHNIILKYFPFFRDKANGHNRFLWWCTLIVTGGFAVFTMLAVIFKHSIIAYYSKKSPLLAEYFIYVTPFALATLYFLLFDAYLRSLYKTVVPALIYEVVMRLLTTASIGLYALQLMPFHDFVLVYIAANSIPTLIIIIYTAYLKELHFKKAVRQYGARFKYAIFQFGAFSFFNNLCGILLVTLDSLMVAGMLGLEKTGIYTTLFFVSSMLLIPYRAIVKIASPLVADFWKKNNLVEMKKIYQQVSSVNILVGSVFFTLLWVNLDLLFYFLPAAYRVGKFSFLFICIGKLFDMFTGINGIILVTSKKYKWDLLFSILLIVLLFAFNGTFIKLYGMEGAAIGTSLAIIIYNSLRLLFIYKNYKIQPFQLRAIAIIPFSVLLIFIINAIPFNYNLIVTTFLKTFLCLCYFFTVIYLVKPTTDVDLVLHKTIKRFRKI